MLLDKCKWAALVIVMSGLTLTGAAALARQGAQPSSPRPHRTGPPPLRVAADMASAGDAAQTAVERPSSTTKPMEFMSDRLAIEAEIERRAEAQAAFVAAAQAEWSALMEEYKQHPDALERAYEASKRLMAAETATPDASAGASRTAAEAHLARIRQLARTQIQNVSGTESHRAQIDAYAAEAALWIADAELRAHDKPRAARSEPRSGSGSEPAPGGDPQSQRIIAKLDEPLVMKFGDETPLEDILKYIQVHTQGPGLPKGIPIYVDPRGLSEADKTMASTVRNLDLHGVPLRRTLQLALAQLDLVYFVEDGMIYITSQDSGYEPLPPARTQPSPLRRKIDQAERGGLSLKELKELAEELKVYNEIQKTRHEGEPKSGGGVQ